MPFFPMPVSGRRGDYAIFSDESCISRDRYMVIGGVLCRTEDANEIALEIAALKRGRFQDSFQWKNITDKKLDLYEKFVRLVLEYVDERVLDFGAMIVTRPDLDHTRFNQGDGELGFSKLLYQLNLKFARNYPTQSTFKSYHGWRESAQSLDEMKEMLNATCFKEFFDLHVAYSRFLEIKYAAVHTNELLQIADVFIGAAGQFANGRTEKYKDTPKGRIAALINAECPASALNVATPMTATHFWIWPFRLQK